MDQSLLNQTELSYTCGCGKGNVNLFTGRLLFEHDEISMGVFTYNISISHYYNSNLELPTELLTHMGDKWKLNIQHYVLKQGDSYCYIDGTGRCIKFQYNGEYYYDKEGIGLRLYDNGNQIVIYDLSDNKMVFENNRLIKTISVENQSIEKIYKYDGDKLVSVYDARKPDNRIVLTYNENDVLDKMIMYEKNTERFQIKYYYNNKNQLVYTSKVVKGVETKYAKFSYVNDQLCYCILLSDKSALKMTYKNNKIVKVETVIAEIYKNDDFSTAANYFDNETYMEKQQYVGENEYIEDYSVINKDYTFSDGLISKNEIDYYTNYTVITNEKDLKMIYYLNEKGYLVSVLESANKDNTDLKTLKKMPGWSMLNENEGTDNEKINTQNAFVVTTDKIISTNDNSLMSKRFSDIAYYRAGMCEAYVNYICSFWLKTLNNFEDSKIKLTIKSRGYTDFNEVYFDKTAINCWQEIRIPIKITNIDIESVELEFSEKSSTKIVKIADMKLYYSPVIEVMLTDQNVWGKLSDVKQIRYITIDKPQEIKTIELDSNNYISEKDIQLIYLNRFKKYKNANNVESYLIFYNDGTDSILVKSASLYIDDQHDFPFKFSDDEYTEILGIKNTRAQYYMQSLSPDGDLYVYNIPHFIPKYQIENKEYDCICNITEGNRYAKIGANGKVPKDHRCSSLMSFMDLKGKKLLEQDEYGVQTIFEYDIYGQEKSKIVTNKDSQDIKIVLNTETTANSQTNSDGIVVQKTYYDEVNGNVIKDTASSNKNPTKINEEYTYGYDYFDKEVINVKSNFGATNFIKYDQTGNIVELSPQKYDDENYYGFKFNYNKYGDPTKFFYTYKSNKQIVNDLVLEKVIDKINGTIKIRKYRNNDCDQTVTQLDKYGRVTSIELDDKKISFERQKLWESDGASAVIKAVDTSENKTYSYEYDDFNNMTRCTIDDAEDDSQLILEKNNPNETIYRENFVDYSNLNDTFTISKVEYDDAKVLSPRVASTNQIFAVGEKVRPIEYKYDSIGRLNGKTINIYNSGNYFQSDINYTKDYNSNNALLNASKVVINPKSEAPTTFDFKYKYDDIGNLTDYKHNVSFKDKIDSYNHSYKYNDCDQLIEEYSEFGNYTNKYEYNSDGSIKTILTNNKVIKYNYESGKLKNIDGENLYEFTYDNFGNILSYGEKKFSWFRGKLLKEYINDKKEKTKYEYDCQGKMYKKILSDGVEIKYHYDSEKLISESWSNGVYIRYLYDLEGVIGFQYQGYEYYYVKDDLGNVVSVIDQGQELVHYDYDSFGNCMIVKNTISLGEINPFRWRSMYCERESNIYIINDNYYLPELRQYLARNPFELFLANSSNANTLYPYQCVNCNPIDITFKCNNILTGLPLVYDPPKKTGIMWHIERFFRSAIGKIVAAALAVVAIVICLLSGNIFSIIELGIDFLVIFITLNIGAIKAGISSAKKGKGFWNEYANYINNNWAFPVAMASAVYIISFCLSKLIAKIKECFIAGTLVLASTGLVKIEDIKEGDEVWSFNEVTGKKELKTVLNIFRGETKEWLHIKIENAKSHKIEKIICTPNHRIYIKGKGWIAASNLVENDEVFLYNGTEGYIKEISLEKLEQAETIYNFEVADNHNYFVSEEEVLVHNKCTSYASKEFKDWLNKGDNDNKVYRGIDYDNKEIYVGITKQDIEARLRQHKKAGKPFKNLNPEYTELTRNQARAIETYIIEQGVNVQMNKILSISRKNKFYKEAMIWAKIFIGGK